jgi:hypothetical protein
MGSTLKASTNAFLITFADWFPGRLNPFANKCRKHR